MREIRLLVIAVGCLIGGPYLIAQYFSALPAIDSLEKVSGVVQIDAASRSTRRSTVRHPVLIIEGARTRYSYLDWFPKADRLASLVRSGQEVTILTDKGKNDWVWQVEQDGRVIIDYSEVRAAVAANRRFDWLLGAGVFALGVATSVILYRRRTRPPEPQP